MPKLPDNEFQKLEEELWRKDILAALAQRPQENVDIVPIIEKHYSEALEKQYVELETVAESAIERAVKSVVIPEPVDFAPSIDEIRKDADQIRQEAAAIKASLPSLERPRVLRVVRNAEKLIVRILTDRGNYKVVRVDGLISRVEAEF